MESSHNLDNNVENNKNNSEIFILSILEKSFLNNNIKELNFNIPIKKRKNENSKVDSDDNITLFNALYNSLINKDNKSFLFCIQQKNETLIEETVKQMNNDCIEKFIEKSLDIFQSNSYSIYVKSILSWIKNVIKFKKIYLLSKNNIENLLKIQIYIKDKIKCFNNLSLLKQKMEKMNTILYPAKGNKDNFFKKNDNINNNMENSNKPIIFEPLLTYYESEDEEDKNKNGKNKMKKEGFLKMDEEVNEEDVEMEDENEKEEESEEDYFDEEIDNMYNEENKANHKNIKVKDLNNISEEEDNEEEIEDIEED
jgi:hypothetical protein